jgi:DNA-binding CsgD family transcriptional regulator
MTRHKQQVRSPVSSPAIDEIAVRQLAQQSQSAASRGLRGRFDLRLLGYALYLTGTFCYQHSATMFSPVTSGNPSAESSAQALTQTSQGVWEPFLLFFLVTQVVLFTCAALFIRRLPPQRVMQGGTLAAGAALVVGAVCVFYTQQAGEVEMPLFLAISALAFGIGDMLFSLAWGFVASTLAPQRLYPSVILCYMISLILYLFISLLPEPAMLPLLILLPVSSAALLIWALARSPRPISEMPTHKALAKAARLLWRPLVATAVFAFMSGLMSLMTGQEQLSLAAFQQISVIASLIIVTLLFMPALFLKSTPSITSAYRVALPIAAAGFLLLPFISPGFAGIANALVNMGYLTVFIILWCAMASCAAATQLAAPLVFGAGLALTVAFTLLGKLTGAASASSLGSDFVALAAVALCSVYLLSLLSLFILRGQRAARGHAAEGGGAVPVVVSGERYVQRCKELAVTSGLTQREQEILLLLGQGRSIANIAAMSYVSENTVKSHIRSIYRKVGVHSKQALIDQLDRESASKGEG